jgi:lysophospholipid acyltransferase (LPLAT)-like uncharacterized protein
MLRNGLEFSARWPIRGISRRALSVRRRSLFASSGENSLRVNKLWIVDLWIGKMALDAFAYGWRDKMYVYASGLCGYIIL